ncbi:MAG TPA: HlyD family efflux transporter periplasmic adaptor subunit [Polyangiaceae bacterium]
MNTQGMKSRLPPLFVRFLDILRGAIIIGRMVNNPLRTGWRTAARGVAALALVFGCSRAAHPPDEEIYQGVAELDERRLAFELSGRVVSVKAREGDRVAAGAIMATLNGALDAQARVARDLEARAAEVEARLVAKGARPEEASAARARIRAAKAAEELLKRQLDRERSLHDRGVTPEARLDELEGQHARAVAEREALESNLADLLRGARSEEREAATVRAEAARAAVTLDDLKLERSELRAPADCVVLDVLAEPGEVVGPGAPVFTVADPGRVYAEVFVPEGRLSGIDVGDRARIRADGVGASLGGRVEHVSRRAEFTPRYLFSDRERPHLVVRVKIRIEDPKALLHAGVPVFVGIDRDTPAPAASRTTAP